MLCATAFRTNLADSWSFKFYRYDARGRVIRFWQKIAGMDSVKSMEYLYNGLNQAQNLSYQPGRGDWKFFRFTYDDAARLNKVGFWTFNGSPGIGSGTDTFSVPDEEAVGDGISGWNFEPYIDYRYNDNQQVDTMIINASANPLLYKHFYNNRNWLHAFGQPGTTGRFAYGLAYNPNGNIRTQNLAGSYSSGFSSPGSLNFTYIYDNSNRLVKADYDSLSNDSTFDLINAYDKDGNLKKMKRFGSNNNLADNFSYEYFSGTNKLRKTSGSTDQYTYDANGNMTKDELNKNYNVLYDWRNLITDIKTVRFEDSPFGPTEVIYWTVYKYDEAGSRVRKITYKYTGSEPDPIYEDGGDNPLWQLFSNEFYVRDLTGKEIAIYSGSSLQYWNMWGLDNVGKINSDTTRNYYLKDHLGSIRAVLNSTNTVISAQDYDAWGYILQNRSYSLSVMKYDFTGKERDNETNYDYFGARYYDSRIANWTSIDPLLERHNDFTPYNYVLRNPLRMIDPDGKQEEVLGIGYMLLKHYIQADEMRCNQIKLMNDDISMSGMTMHQAIDKYGELAIEKYGGNLQPTYIEFDIALAFSPFKMFSNTATNETITLYRAIGKEELESILSLGKYTLREGGSEVKYFWFTKSDMKWFMKELPGNNEFFKTKIKISKSLLKKADVEFGSDASKHPFVTVGQETLHKFSSSAIQIMRDFSKIHY